MKDDIEPELYPGEAFDWEAPDIDPGSREFLIALQPAFRRDATAIGNFRTCKLPKCRRMKRCTGRHPMERLAIAGDHWSTFPPCVDNSEKQSALNQETRRHWEQLQAELAVQGIDISEYLP